MNRLVADLGPLALLGASLCACGGAKEGARTPPEQAAPLPPEAEAEGESEGEGASKEGDSAAEAPPSGRAWAEKTWSPQPGSAPEPELDDLIEDCGVGDAAL
ncbi:MAG TPA: hypothetical protein VLC09_05600, partial [Polyangiaceae bacterium]|nr:hypothetical protein [Polyangiaceae bacterium]